MYPTLGLDAKASVYLEEKFSTRALQYDPNTNTFMLSYYFCGHWRPSSMSTLCTICSRDQLFTLTRHVKKGQLTVVFCQVSKVRGRKVVIFCSCILYARIQFCRTDDEALQAPLCSLSSSEPRSECCRRHRRSTAMLLREPLEGGLDSSKERVQ